VHVTDLEKIATDIVDNFPGDEYWIDKPAAIAAIAAALRAERERVLVEIIEAAKGNDDRGLLWLLRAVARIRAFDK